jgi:cytochrome b6-f complex iron-sulfur subunit
MEKLITTKSGNLSEERREFLRKTGSLAVMAMFGVGFFTSCSSEDDPAPVANTPNQPPSNDSGAPTSGGYYREQQFSGDRPKSSSYFK